MEKMISPYAWVGMKYKPEGHRQIDSIVNAVCRKYNTSLDSIKIKSRLKEIREPRQITTYLLKKVMKDRITVSEIARIFNQDHTTILHNIKTIQDLIDTDKEFERLVLSIKREI